MRIVVTGATGNVGTSVIDALVADERVDSILGLSRRLPDLEREKVEWAKADVVTDRLEPLFEGADVVIHLAWAIQPSRDEVTTYSVNVRGSQRVFEAVAAASVPALVYASSIGAYSAGPQDDPVDESWPTGGIPSSFYSRHKALVESSLDRFEAEHPDVRVVRLRPALIFKGTAGSEIRRLFGGPFVPTTLIKPSRLPVMPWISGLRTQAVHTDDVAEAYRLAALGDASWRLQHRRRARARRRDRRGGDRRPDRAASGASGAGPGRRHLDRPPAADPAGMGRHGGRRAAHGHVTRPHRARLEGGSLLPGRAAGGARGHGRAGRERTPPLDPKAGGVLRIREILSGIGARK